MKWRSVDRLLKVAIVLELLLESIEASSPSAGENCPADIADFK